MTLHLFLYKSACDHVQLIMLPVIGLYLEVLMCVYTDTEELHVVPGILIA